MMSNAFTHSFPSPTAVHSLGIGRTGKTSTSSMMTVNSSRIAASVVKASTSTSVQSENVKVTVRCRPPSKSECSNCWNIDSDNKKIMSQDSRLKRQHEFVFDNVLYGSDNELLYNSTVKELIHQAMEGFNATVFAYGQTASGKTFTMMGNQDQPGVIPRAVRNVFEFIQNALNKEFLLRVSYLEIYNETIKDLLNPSNDNLKIHQDKVRGVYVTPLTEEVVTCPEDVMRIIERGEANRHISSTDYNLHSSRSHTLFQMIIESREKSSTSTGAFVNNSKRSFTTTGYGMNKSATAGSVKISQLNLIDLAGSEKAASDENRRKEGSYINKSLLTLGTVISKLTEQHSNSSSTHIPFRDSKLTRILQTSLTGLAKVAVICTVSPATSSIEESVNTLKFASRVKRITIHAKNDNVMDDKALLQKYRGEILDLKAKLEVTSGSMTKEKEKIQSAMLAERKDHDYQLQQMRSIRNAMKERIDHLTRLILTSHSTVSTGGNSNNDDVMGGDSIIPSSPIYSSFAAAAAAANVTDQLTPRNSNSTLHGQNTNPSTNEEIIQNLKTQLQRALQESSEKDRRMLSLQEKLEAQTSRVSQLETELSIAKAELEVTQQFRAVTEEENTSSSSTETIKFEYHAQPLSIIQDENNNTMFLGQQRKEQLFHQSLYQ